MYNDLHFKTEIYFYPYREFSDLCWYYSESKLGFLSITCEGIESRKVRALQGCGHVSKVSLQAAAIVKPTIRKWTI